MWDLDSGTTSARVLGDAAFTAVAAATNRLLIAGDAVGNVWFVDLDE